MHPCMTSLRRARCRMPSAFLGTPSQANMPRSRWCPVGGGLHSGQSHVNLVCAACVHEMNDPEQPLVITNLPPAKRAKTISKTDGPCYFGHTHTSACDLNGTPCWFQVPLGITWNGAKPGDTLCNACIVKMRRRQPECEPCDAEPVQRHQESI